MAVLNPFTVFPEAVGSFTVSDPQNPTADLSIATTLSPDSVTAGSQAVFELQVTNYGPDSSTNISLTDAAPANTSFVSFSQSAGPTFNCNTVGGVTTCTLASLSAGGTATFAATYQVNGGTPVNTQISHTASVVSDHDQNSLNNSTTSSATVISTPTCAITCPGTVTATTTTCTAVVNYTTSSTGCGGSPVLCSPPSGSIFPIGTTQVNCTTENGGDCSFNVTVTGNDTTPPSITCPSDVSTPEDPAGSGQASVSYPPPTATDNCTQGLQVDCNAPAGSGFICCTPPSGSSFTTGVHAVTCNATDASNNTSSCSFTVTVVTVTCALTCPDNVTEPPPSSGCSKVVTYPPPTKVGSCGTVTCDPASGSAFPVGTTNVTCTATDTSGNTIATCSFTVTVNDPGTLTCPPNRTVNEDSPGSGSAVVDYDTPATCSGVVATCNPPSGSTFTAGTTTVNCTVPSSGPSCSFTVTVITGTCTISCPNVTKANDPGQCGAIATFPTKSGNCGSDPIPCSPPSGSFFPVGTTSVTCDIGTGPCTFTVTVNDTTPPVVGPCPSNITKNNDPGQCSAVATYTTPSASDNCPGVGPVNCSPASGTAFQKGTTTVTCSATDAHSNTGSCSFTVTVNDTENPTISCPANITQGTDPGQCSAVVNFSATAADNCSGATASCTPASGSTFQKGTTTVTCSATDASGNTSSTCSFTVTVNDTENPTINCPANQTRSTDPNQCSAVVTYPAPTASDNCAGVGSPACSPPSGSAFPKGTTTVTCSVSDASGNSKSCSFTVTVNDTQPPSITCPANMVKEPTCPAGAVASYAPTVSDNCPGVGFVCSPASGSTFAVGTTTVTCTATDTSGNTASCSFTVTVLTAPATIENLKTSINGSSLNGQQKQGLIAKLDAALDAIDKGHINTACQKLADFINSVQTFIDHGDISAAQGQAWINSAANVRNYLGCTNLPCS